MIVKSFNLKKELKDNVNFYLLYGPNNGFIEENTYVENNDIIIGKTMPLKKGENEEYRFKDNSVCLKQNEYGFIDKNYSNNKYYTNTNNEGYKFSKIKMRSIRIPTIGDKLSSRHG